MPALLLSLAVQCAELPPILKFDDLTIHIAVLVLHDPSGPLAEPQNI